METLDTNQLRQYAKVAVILDLGAKQLTTPFFSSWLDTKKTKEEKAKKGPSSGKIRLSACEGTQEVDLTPEELVAIQQWQAKVLKPDWTPALAVVIAPETAPVSVDF
jgi:hypothetical protein